MPKKIDPEAVRSTAEILAVFGAETRLKMVVALAGAPRGELSVGALHAAAGASLSGVSQHLNKMKAWGLVIPRREAQTIYYRLADHAATKAVLGLLEAA